MNNFNQTDGAPSSGDTEKKVSSTLELAKKLGLLNKKDKPKDEISLEPTKEATESKQDIKEPTNQENYEPNLELASKENQDLIDFLLDDDSEPDNPTNDTDVEKIIEIETTPAYNNITEKEVDTNSDSGSSFISLNVEEPIVNIEKKKSKTKKSSKNIGFIEDKGSEKDELLDFLLGDDDNEKSELDSDLSIDDIAKSDIVKSKKVEDNFELEDEIKDEFLDSKESEDKHTKTESGLNSGLLVTPEDIERYFAHKESNNYTKAQDEELEEEKTVNGFNISKNIVDNTPKTDPSGVLTFQAFEFKGKAMEYFKIWIVNIALTIVTLGVYSAWAKVRNLRYIYGNTYLNNSNFEFNADPRRIFYGRLVVFSFYALFLLATDILYNQTLALSIAGIFILLLPWLIKQAVRFKLKSTSYRNIRFKFHGKARSFYMLALGSILTLILVFSPLFIGKIATSFGITIPFLNNYQNAMTLYLALFFIFVVVGIPIIYKKFKDIIINNSSYGNEMFSFHATKRGAILTFIKMAFTTAFAGFLLGLIVVIPKKFFGIDIININSADLSKIDSSTYLAAAIGFLIYLASLGLYKGISDGFLSNFVRNNTKLGSGEFKTSIYPFKLGIISMTNILAIVLSFGLLYPWAKMRYLKYKIENTQFACRDYNKFSSVKSKEVSTIGEEATDFFDIDIGV